MNKKDNIKTYRRSTWHRGDICNFYPNPERGDYDEQSRKNIVEKFILPGWTPDAPFITKQHKITVFGSCFAWHILAYLQYRGYAPCEEHSETYILRHGSGMVTTHTIRQQFEWAYENRKFSEDIWFKDPEVLERALDRTRLETKELLDNTDVFIITLGLSEVWYHKKTGDVFWKAIPGAVFDPDEHGFRVSTFAENKDNLTKILSLIGKHRPSATVIFTLSPVTLVATFRPVSCITADSVSKSILRSSVDEVVREYQGPLSVRYWPSYEIVKEFYPESYETDRRHVTGETVNLIMDMFNKYYLKE